MSTTKKIAKNFSWLLAGNTTSGLLNFLAVIYVARVLGAAGFGLWQFAMAFLAYLVLLVDSGLSMYGMREIAQARHRAGGIALNLFAIRFLIASVVYLISAAMLFLLPVPLNLRLVFLAVFLLVFYRALNADWVFQGLEKMEFISLAKLCFASGSLLFIFLLVKAPGDLIRVPLIQAVCGILASTAFVFFLFQRLVKAARTELLVRAWPGYMLAAIPLGASIIMIQIYNNLDTIMLGFMSRVEIVGYYNAAYQIFYVFIGLFYIWLSTAMPVMNRRVASDKAGAERFIAKYARLTMMAFVPLVVFVFIAARPIVVQTFGGTYAPAAAALRILIWNLITVIVGSIYGVLILIPAGRFKEYFIAVLSGAVVNVALNFLLIPAYSFYGAAAATLIAEATAVTITIIYARRIIPLSLIGHLGKALAVSAPAAGLFYLIVWLRRPLAVVWPFAGRLIGLFRFLWRGFAGAGETLYA